MSKITGIKIKNSDNTYSTEIPFGVSASNVEWDSSNTLVDIIEDLQEQSGGQQTITGAASTIVSDNLTASRAVVSNASGKVAVSDVTSTELGYLDGVTSNIQTQINSTWTKLNDIDGYLTYQQANPVQHGYWDPQTPGQSYPLSTNLESGVWKAVQTFSIGGPGMFLFLIDAKFPANGTGIRSVKVTLGDTSTQLNSWAVASESGSANADTTIKMIVPFYLTYGQLEEAWENQQVQFYIKVYQDSGQTMQDWADINVYPIYFKGYVPDM